MGELNLLSTRRSFLAGSVAVPATFAARKVFAGQYQGFHVYKSPPGQIGLPNRAYTKVIFDATQAVGPDGYQHHGFDTSGRFDVATSRWYPVLAGEPPKLVQMSGQVWVIGGAGGDTNPIFVAKIKKNGNPATYLTTQGDVFAGIGAPDTALRGTVAVQFSGNDLAQPGDYYELIFYGTAATTQRPPFYADTLGTLDFDNEPAHHFWCGEYGQ